jgi:hypothetical protein
LDDIIEDSCITDEAKFLACIVLDKMDASYKQRHSQQKIARIFVTAFVNDYPLGMISVLIKKQAQLKVKLRSKN